jgi:hypothetical protein
MEINREGDSNRSSFYTSANGKSLFDLFKTNAYKIITFVLSTLLTVLVISIGLVMSTAFTGYYEYNIKNPVDKNSCKCDCWDGLYRGVHARESHNTLYKAFYFNYDKQLIVILFAFLLYAQLLREILVKIIKTFLQNFHSILNNSSEYSNDSEVYKRRNIRYGVLINLIVSTFSNYFGLWAIINYLNDRDYRMIRSQIFFSLTELLPSYLYFEYLNRFDLDKKALKPISLSIVYPIFFICSLHIYLASFERILWGFFTGNHDDANRNKVRDILLITNDIGGFLFSIYYLYKSNRISSMENVIAGHGHFYYIKYWLFITLILYIIYYLFCSF